MAEWNCSIHSFIRVFVIHRHSAVVYFFVSEMFANLKKKIELEVGDLSRLTPSLRNSEKLTPLSSRHNSVSSLTSETSTSYTNKLSSPTTNPPFDQAQHYGKHHEGASNNNGGTSKLDNSIQQNKVKRQYEEKIQTLELDLAWRLSSKDEEITKLKKQLEHANTLLHSKEYYNFAVRNL